jgi:hypothetical protein
VASTDVTPTHGTVLELIRKVEEAGHKIFVGNYFTIQNFSMIYITGKYVNACGTFCHNGKEVLPNSSLHIYD